MENNANFVHFLCEDKIIVRAIKEKDRYTNLEYYSPKIEGWIPSEEWYNDMFVKKVVNYRKITREELLFYQKSSIEYFKRVVSIPIYLRRIYGIHLELFDEKTGSWKKVTNDEWNKKIDEYTRVPKEEVEQFIKQKKR